MVVTTSWTGVTLLWKNPIVVSPQLRIMRVAQGQESRGQHPEAGYPVAYGGNQRPQQAEDLEEGSITNRGLGVIGQNLRTTSRYNLSRISSHSPHKGLNIPKPDLGGCGESCWELLCLALPQSAANGMNEDAVHQGHHSTAKVGSFRVGNVAY